MDIMAQEARRLQRLMMFKDEFLRVFHVDLSRYLTRHSFFNAYRFYTHFGSHPTDQDREVWKQYVTFLPQYEDFYLSYKKMHRNNISHLYVQYVQILNTFSEEAISDFFKQYPEFAIYLNNNERLRFHPEEAPTVFASLQNSYPSTLFALVTFFRNGLTNCTSGPYDARLFVFRCRYGKEGIALLERILEVNRE